MILIDIAFGVENIVIAYFLLRPVIAAARRFIDHFAYMDERLNQVESDLDELGDEVDVLNTVLRDVYQNVGEIGDVVFLPETPQPKERHLKAVRGDDDDAG